MRDERMPELCGLLGDSNRGGHSEFRAAVSGLPGEKSRAGRVHESRLVGQLAGDLVEVIGKVGKGLVEVLVVCLLQSSHIDRLR